MELFAHLCFSLKQTLNSIPKRQMPQDLLTEVHLERVRRRSEGHFSTQARDIPFLSFRENWGCLLELRRR